MDKLTAQFIEEGRELITQAAQGLLKLERAPNDSTLLDALFREVHTLKGSAGVLELTPMVNVVHVAEELMEKAKSGATELDADTIDVMLDAMDLLNGWLDHLEDNGSLPEEAGADGKAMAERLSALKAQHLGTEQSTEGAAQTDSADERAEPATADAGEGVSWGLFDDEPVAVASDGAMPEWLSALTETQRQTAWQAAVSGTPLWCVTFRPEQECYFRGDDPLFMVRQTPGLQAVYIGLDSQPEEELAELDVFQCRLWFGVLAKQGKIVLEEHFQYEQDTVDIEPLQPEGLIQPVGSPLGQPLDEALLQDLQHHWENRNPEAIGKALQVQLELLNAHTREASLLRWLQLVVTETPDDSVVFDTLLGALQAPDETLNVAGQIDWQALLPAAPTSGADAQEVQPAPETVVSDDDSSAEPSAQRELEAGDAVLQALFRDQLRLLTQCRDAELRAGAVASVRRVLNNAARANHARLPAALQSAEDQQALEQALKGWLNQAATEAQAPPPASAPPQPETKARQPAEPSKERRDSVNDSAKPSGRESPSPVIRTFKVDQEQVEELGDLVGEMVVAKNALPFLAQRAEQEFGQRQLGREIREQFNVINRITRALQDAMMQVQMLPVAHVFDRFPRLVRDLSRKLDKPIDLEIDGQDTEAEKHVIESLADPLVHLMRNAIDHGIEPRSVRKAAGKSETGKISLSAWQENEWAVIEVADDGGGIDPEKTRRRAYEKGLVDERRLKEMTDQEAIELIFMAGFSTMEVASDLSGRGVGMDVVQTTIEKSGGRLEVESRLGEGSRFRLWLPLSMSISQVMQIWIDGQRYGIPMDQVAETVRLPRERLHQFKDRETVMLRDRVLPVCRGREQLGLERQDDGATVALLVVRFRGEPVALMVDDFSEGVEVILKPMEGALEHLGVYQGTALLGDGSVLLVLNIGVLLSTVKLEEVAHDHTGEG
ncbi:MAG: chemotaxis protein CheA [Natronospirillum sp.]|uniref:chemotaxis protein CheA n=1 Tax=Natronospirillum sp. TaxID=2812955 RepID=UPI0025FA7948|nr:chemotaxis protein CheA [Natronospirillum sp.]MCH8550390.1 chemotaxis protein CheA [Natronospirillum sp.]